MASQVVALSRRSLMQNHGSRLRKITKELLLKRNVSQYKEHLKQVESHAQETWITWKKISMFVAVPVSSYLFYKHIIVGEHMEAPKEFIPYEHIRLRRKPFPWGDGDKSLFHNDKFNVGPDTDFEGQDEHEHHEQEPFITRLFRRFMEKEEDLIKFRDDHLREMHKIAVNNLKLNELPNKQLLGRDVFAIHDSLPKIRPASVDE